jgi:type II restriction enzyme
MHAGSQVESTWHEICSPPRRKAPDLIVWDKEHNWVFVMEACSTHGPVDVMRKRELRSLFDCIRPPMVFVSCFPDRNVMGKYLADLAWETEAWCADTPDHMVHLDGMRFLGPYEG